MQNEQAPPVSAGEEIDVLIESVGEKGDGIAKKRGFVIFVPKGERGQEVHIKISKVLKNVAFAENLGPATGPVEGPARNFRPAQVPKKEEIDFKALGDGSEEF